MAPENEDLSTSASGDHSSGDGAGLPGGPQAARPAKTQLDVWADQLADYVVQGVGWLKARTTTRAQTALRAVVYGVVLLVSLFAAFVLLIISLVRIWDVYVPIEPLGRRVWLGYVTFGGLFFIAGAVLLLWKSGDDE
jgi:uncharacterized BrkB/YihY/UPF0761 family membrane protein